MVCTLYSTVLWYCSLLTSNTGLSSKTNWKENRWIGHSWDGQLVWRAFPANLSSGISEQLEVFKVSWHPYGATPWTPFGRIWEPHFVSSSSNRCGQRRMKSGVFVHMILVFEHASPVLYLCRLIMNQLSACTKCPCHVVVHKTRIEWKSRQDQNCDVWLPRAVIRWWKCIRRPWRSTSWRVLQHFSESGERQS